MIYKHDIPESVGMENALKRAKQMTDIFWNPVRALPAGYGHWNPAGELCYSYFYFPQYQPQCGLIYSSVRESQKYVGVNVSFETYLSALANPDSVLYTKPLQGKSPGEFCYYGVVCSILVCYAFNISIQIPCIRWEMEPGVSEVDISDFNNIKLCDFVLDPNLHIALITDIVRDENGNIVELTTSESTQPKCLVTKFTAEQFKNYWLIHNNYKVCRYSELDQVPYTPDPFIQIDGDPKAETPKINSDILPNFGNKANYELGEKVRFFLFNQKWTDVTVCGPTSEALPVADQRSAFVPREPGFYSAKAYCSDQESDCVEFCVTDCKAETVKTEYTTCEDVLVHYNNSEPSDEIVGYMVNDGLHYMHGRKEFKEKMPSKGTINIGRFKKRAAIM